MEKPYLPDHFSNKESYDEYMYNYFKDNINNPFLIKKLSTNSLLKTFLNTLTIDEQLYLYSLIKDKEDKHVIIDELLVMTLFSETKIKSTNLIKEIFNKNIISLRQYLLYLISNDKLSSVNLFLYNFTPNPSEIKNILKRINKDDYYFEVLEEYVNQCIMDQV